MGVEIERKYLVTGREWKTASTRTLLQQGYLNADKDKTVRVRTLGTKGVLTIKGRTVGATRLEFEYEIPLDDAQQLLALCAKPLIEKTRYTLEHAGQVWEVDEFHGANDGLVIAECELETEDQPVAKPKWIGREVTGDRRYYNSNLIAHPFSAW